MKKIKFFIPSAVAIILLGLVPICGYFTNVTLLHSRFVSWLFSFAFTSWESVWLMTSSAYCLIALLFCFSLRLILTRKYSIIVALCATTACFLGTIIQGARTYLLPREFWENTTALFTIGTVFFLVVCLDLYLNKQLKTSKSSEKWTRDSIIMAVLEGVFWATCFSGFLILSFVTDAIGLSTLENGLFSNIELITRSAVLGIDCYIFYVVKKTSRNGTITSITIWSCLMISSGLLWLFTHNSSLHPRSIHMKVFCLFWTAMGLLLYDLGCFVAERIRKKLASKKQGSLEETAEA